MISLLSAVAALTMLIQQTLTMDATHYGTSYNGRTTACGTTYWSDDHTIAASGLHANGQPIWPCWTKLYIEGSHGDLEVTVVDRCRGCGYTKLDLSEAGVQQLCGQIATCRNVRVTPA